MKKIALLFGLFSSLCLHGQGAGQSGAFLQRVQLSTLNAQRSTNRHWSFNAPERSALPAVRQSEWVRHPIDAFVLAGLEKESIAPSPEANRWTLIRRLSFDLLGLPPSPEEVRAFVNDPRPEAYENLVDRLLASPHFGERWGRHWLDLARYADSDGYEKDSPRPYAYRYRDWVIDAINRDLPFDQFTIEQLAGDLLPNADEEQRMATGFHRNTLTNKEGGVDQEEFRCKATVDRVSTTGTVWLGLTVGCAECHSHKYDPISQREFYQLYAFFNSASEKDIPAPRADELARYQREKKAWQARQNQLQRARAAYLESGLLAKQAEWERTVALPRSVWAVLTPKKVAVASGANLQVREDGSVHISGKRPASDRFTVEAESDLTKITGFRLEIFGDGGAAKDTAQNKNGGLQISEFTVSVQAPVEAAALALRAGAGRAAEDGAIQKPDSPRNSRRNEAQITAPLRPETSQDQSLLTSAPTEKLDASTLPKSIAPVAEKIRLSHPSAFPASKDSSVDQAIDGNPKTSWMLGANSIGRVTAVFETDAEPTVTLGSKLAFEIEQASGSPQTLSRFRIAATASERPLKAEPMPDSMVRILRARAERRSKSEQTELANYYREEVDPTLRKLNEELAEHARSEPKFPETKAQTLVENDSPRKTNIHIRGDFLRPGDEVQPGTFAVLPPLRSRGEKADRLDLARWLFDPANPLTARVAVNRLWSHLFGRGLVASLNDFGTRGEAPSHPELLDWLATEFPRLGWSRKQLIKLIVTSATYRQASATRPELLERDPNNLWLARQNRFRLEAENVRDAALSVSGLLKPTVGGPPIRPPLPADIAALGYANSVKWKESEGEDRYRRGLYIFFQRTVRYPMLVTFDAPDSNVTCTRRERSNTPLQALTLLNDAVFFECARAFGKTLAEDPGTDPRAKLRQGFERCLARPPTPEELARLETLYQDYLRLTRNNREAAARIVGDSGTDGAQLAETAAWIAVGRTLLNLDEFVTRE